MATVESSRRGASPIYEGTRIPSPIPTILQVDPAKHDLEGILTVNFGPKLISRMSSVRRSSSGTSSTDGIGCGMRDPS